MTTNSIDRMPTAFPDRCKVIRLESPGFDHLATVGASLLRKSLPDAYFDIAQDLFLEGLRKLEKRHVGVSLRQVERMVETVVEGMISPRLM